MDVVPKDRRWRRWALILAGWAFFGLFFASQSVVGQAHAGRPVEWGRTLGAWMICAGIWAALTPVVLWLGRRFPFERGRWRSSALLHLGASVFLATLALGIYLLCERLWLDPARPVRLGQSLRSLLVTELHSNALIYWGILGISRAIDYYRRYRDQEVAALELSAQLAEARLEALERQLHPHFLFNTLNTIAVLMRKDVAAADRVLVRLSQLLRTVLDRNGSHEVTLGDELRFLRGYLEIEQVRYQDRLQVELEIEPAALEASVPRLLLQPLVENALRHGIAAREAEGGRIEVRAARENGSLQLTIRDNGPGLAANGGRDVHLSRGIGLSTTRARLERMYGAGGRLELHDATEGGLEVLVILPFRRGSEATGKARHEST